MKSVARSITPAPLWRAASRLKAHVLPPDQGPSYQGVRTVHSTRALHTGPFADIYERYWRLDPSITETCLRLRLYYACYFAKRAPAGDFAFVGVSYGVAPRVLYDYVRLAGRTLHLVDPFTGMAHVGGPALSRYNTSAEFVAAQFPPDADLRFHRCGIPAGLPLDGVEKLAFVHFNTGDAVAEATSLPDFFDRLLLGGAIVIDKYANAGGSEAVYDPVFARLGVEPLWLPTGQAVLEKR